MKCRVTATYTIEAYERRDLKDRKYKKVYKNSFDSYSDAELVAKEVLRRISDVYGFSYVDILDEDREILDTISNIYDSNADSDLSLFSAEDFLKSLRG